MQPAAGSDDRLSWTLLIAGLALIALGFLL
jgi:hypothetical protein